MKWILSLVLVIIVNMICYFHGYLDGIDDILDEFKQRIEDEERNSK